MQKLAIKQTDLEVFPYEGHDIYIYRWHTMRWYSVVGVSGAERGELEECNWWKRQTILLLHTDRKHQTLRVACSEKGHWANTFGMRSSNSLPAMKSCARASINHVVGVGLYKHKHTHTHIPRMLRCGYFIHDLATLFRLRGLLQGRTLQWLINSEWQGMGQDGVLSCFQIPSRW